MQVALINELRNEGMDGRTDVSMDVWMDGRMEDQRANDTNERQKEEMNE